MSCTHKFILKLGNVLDGLNENIVLLDPAGLRFIQNGATKGAGGLSGQIYTKFQIQFFPADVQANITKEQDAFYFQYNPTSHVPPVRIIHAVGPILSNDTKDEHHLFLTLVYSNIFYQFLEHCSDNDTLRLVPISTGIFNEATYSNPALALLSIPALFEGLKEAESYHKRKIKNIDLYFNDKEMFQAFLKVLPEDRKIVMK